MATDLERLVVQLSADTKQYQNALNRAMGVTNRQARAVESRFKAMNTRVASSLTGMAGRIGTAFAAGLSVQQVKKFSDAATRIDNSLKVAGLSGEELEKVYNRLRDSATKNAAPIEALVELYGRAALVQKELGISGEELLNFTDKIAVALRVSGRSAAESSGALLQLSQALGSGVVRAEEFNSILEGALPIAQAAAAGLKEAGGSVAKLRQLVVDGKVSSEAFFRAFEAGAPILEEKVADATFTVDQAVGNLSTALIDVAREFNTSTGAAGRFAGGINNIAQAVSDFDVSGFISKIQEAHGALDRFLDDLANSSYMEKFAEWITGTELTVGRPIAVETLAAEKDLSDLERQIKILEDRINANKEMAIDTAEAEGQLNSLIAKANALRAAMETGVVNQQSVDAAINRMVPFNPLPAPTLTPKTVSLNDFDPPGGGGGGRRGRKGRRGGGDRQNELQREIQQIQDRTAAIQAETEAMAGLNPLIEDYGYTLEKARAKQDLLTAAKKAGVAITPELEAQIEKLAEGYAQASVAAEKLADSQEKARQQAEEMRDLGKDVLGGFIKDLQSGKSASEALAGALQKVADKLLDIALNSMFDAKGGLFGGGGGFLGLLSGLFREKGGPVRKGQPYIVGEKRPEVFVPDQNGQILPSVPSFTTMPKLAAPAGPASTETIRVVLQDDSGRMADIADQQIRTRSGALVQLSVQQSVKSVRGQMSGMIAETQARKL